VTAGRLIGSITKAWSVDAGSVNVVAGFNSSPRRDNSIHALVVSGTFADISSKVRLGFTACEASSWHSSTSLSCSIASGSQSAQPIAITSELQVYTVSGVVTYDNPQIHTSEPTNSPTIGQYTLTIVGSNMMIFSVSPTLRVGLTASPASAWIASSSLSCRAPPGGHSGKDPAVIISMANIIGTRSEGFTYDAPTIVNAKVSRTKSADVGALVDLLGINFGSTDHSMSAAVGIVTCDSSQWVSDSSISCAVPTGFDEDALLIAASKGNGRICTRCASGFTVACSSSSAGYCIECITCSIGEYTSNCNSITEIR